MYEFFLTFSGARGMHICIWNGTGLLQQTQIFFLLNITKSISISDKNDSLCKACFLYRVHIFHTMNRFRRRITIIFESK